MDTDLRAPAHHKLDREAAEWRGKRTQGERKSIGIACRTVRLLIERSRWDWRESTCPDTHKPSRPRNRHEERKENGRRRTWTRHLSDWAMETFSLRHREPLAVARGVNPDIVSYAEARRDATALSYREIYKRFMASKTMFVERQRQIPCRACPWTLPSSTALLDGGICATAWSSREWMNWHCYNITEIFASIRSRCLLSLIR